MASNNFLPKVGAGEIRDPFNNSTGPDRNGRVLNPPIMSKMGGFNSTRKGINKNDLSIVKPGGAK